MNNNQPNNDLPSTEKLVKSTIFASILAMVILVVAVLPAEYGIDPTGAGDALGLTRMGQIKMSLAEEAVAEKEKAAEVHEVAVAVTKTTEEKVEPQPSKEIKAESITVSLAPDEAREIKVSMVKGSKVSYSWKTSNDRANFDVHGDSKKLKIRYHNYSKGSAESDSGVLEAEFDGKHGWFWRNRSGNPMTITLEVEGEFAEMTQEV